MEINKLVALLETVQLKSIRKAAEKLGYTQPGLTYMLNSLESELGIVILNRNYSGVTFTKEGLELEPYIRTLVNDEATLRQKISRMNQSGDQTIRIGSYSSIAGSYLPKILKAFSEKNPSVRIEIRIGVEEIPNWLHKGEIEIGFCEQELAEGFTWIPLWSDQMCALVPANLEFPSDTPVPLERLIQGPLLAHSSNTRNTLANLLKDHINEGSHNILFSTTEGAAIIEMVTEGPYISFLTELFKAKCPPTIRMLPIDPPMFRQLGIISNLNEFPKEKQALIKKFIKFAQKYQESSSK